MTMYAYMAMYNLHEFYMFVDIDRILISKEYSFLHHLLIYVHSALVCESLFVN